MAFSHKIRYILKLCIPPMLYISAKKIYMRAKSFKKRHSAVIFEPHEYIEERCKNRKLFIYGIGLKSAKLTKSLMKRNIFVECYLDDENYGKTFRNKEIKATIDITNEKPEGIFIIIVNEKESYGISRQKFIKLGLIENVHFTYYKSVPMIDAPLHYDVTLSYSRMRGQMEGFEVFGNYDNPDALKIVALGGSTTESEFMFVKGWAQYLTDMLIDNGKNVVMYCGGVVAYGTTQGLLKLIRDVLPAIKPDVVLYYGGFSDIKPHPHFNTPKLNMLEREGRPFLTNHQIRFAKQAVSKYPKSKQTVYYGLTNDKTASEIWIDNIRMMHAILKEFNVLFLAFLPPCYFVGNYKANEYQRIIFKRKGWEDVPAPEVFTPKNIEYMIKEYAEIKDKIGGMGYVSDLTDIFDDKDNIYIDYCHVFEHGNQIIAKKIYETLTPHIQD